MGAAEEIEELAIALFRQNRITLGQAARLTQMQQLDFQRLLAERKISIHYGQDQLERDLKRAAELPLLWSPSPMRLQS